MVKKSTLIGLVVCATLVVGVGATRVHAQSEDQGDNQGDQQNNYGQMMGGLSTGDQGGDQNRYGKMMKPLVNMNQQGHEGENGQGGQMETKESASLRPDGSFNVTGVKVNSVDAASGSVNVTLFGFSRTVTISGATIMGSGKAISMSDIQAGDVLAAMGTFNVASHAISVSRVMDVSYVQRNNTNIQSKIQELLQMVRSLQAQLQVLQGQGQ